MSQPSPLIACPRFPAFSPDHSRISYGLKKYQIDDLTFYPPRSTLELGPLPDPTPMLITWYIVLDRYGDDHVVQDVSAEAWLSRKLGYQTYGLTDEQRTVCMEYIRRSQNWNRMCSWINEYCP